MKANSRFVVIILVGVLALLTLFVGCEDPPVVEALQSVEGVAISGDAYVGGTLQATPDPAGAKVFYQWLISDLGAEDFKEISGAVGSTYEVEAEDLGKFIKVRVTGRNNFIGTVSSEAKEIKAAPIKAIGAITGELIVGQTLTAGEVTPAGATVDYQWMARETEDGEYEAITNATDSTYVIEEDYAGSFIKVQVTGKENYTGTVTSTAVGPVISIDQADVDAAETAIGGADYTDLEVDDLTDQDLKTAAVKAVVDINRGDVTATVTWDSEDDVYDVALSKGDASASLRIDSATFVLSQAGQDQAAAEAVDTLIGALPAAGTVTLENKVQIEAARTAYDALTSVQQGLVEELAALEAAEAELAVLEAEAALQAAVTAATEELGKVATALEAYTAAGGETTAEVYTDVTAAQTALQDALEADPGVEDTDEIIAATLVLIAKLGLLEDATVVLNQDSVATAIGLVPGTIESITVSGGAEADIGDKEEAVKDYLEAIEGMADLDVEIAVVWNSEESKFDVTITKGETATASAKVEVSEFVKTQAELDQADVDAALVLLPEEAITSVSVLGGDSAADADKALAVQAYLAALEGMADLDVEIAVAFDADNKFAVTITKGEAEETASVTVTAFVKTQEELIQQAKADFLDTLTEEAGKITAAEVEIDLEDITATFINSVEPSDVYQAAEDLLGVFQTELDSAKLTITLGDDTEGTFNLDDEDVVTAVANFLLGSLSAREFLEQGVAIEADYTAEVIDKEGVAFELGGQLTFVVSVDLTAYQAALAAVGEEDNYTEDSWATYQMVLAANVMTEDNTQSEIDAATATITAAQANLITLEALEAAIAAFEESVEDIEDIKMNGKSIASMVFDPENYKTYVTILDSQLTIADVSGTGLFAETLPGLGIKAVILDDISYSLKPEDGQIYALAQAVLEKWGLEFNANGLDIESKEIAFVGTIQPEGQVEFKKDFTFVYELDKYEVTIQGDKGTITGAGTYAAGQEVTLEVTEVDSGYQFHSWADANGNEIGTDKVYTFVMPNSDVEIIVNFVMGLDGLVGDGSIEQIDARNNMEYPWIKDQSITDRIAYYPTNQGIGNSRSSITCTVSGKGVLSYDYKVSAEDNYDYMIVYLDGEIVREYKTETDWKSDFLELNDKSQIVKFEYKKDSSWDSNDDKVWLANVQFFAPDEIATMPEITLYHENDVPLIIKDGDVVIRDLDIDSNTYTIGVGTNETGSIIKVYQNNTEISISGNDNFVLTVDDMSIVEIVSSKEDFFTTRLTFEIKVFSVGLKDLISGESQEYIAGSNDLTYPWVEDTSITDKKAYYPTNQGIGNSSSFATFTINTTGKLTYDYRVSAENNYDYMKVYLDDELIKEYKTSGEWQSDYINISYLNQIVKFEYKKDGSTNRNDDKVWLANLELEPINAAIMPVVTLSHGGEDGLIVNDGDIVVRDLEKDSTEEYILSLGENPTDSDIVVKQEGVIVNPSQDGNYTLMANETSKSIQLTSMKDGLLTTELTFWLKAYAKTLKDIIEESSREYINGSNDRNYPWVKDDSISGRVAYYPTNQGVGNSSSFATFEVTGTGMLVYDYRVSAENNYDYMKVYLDDVLVKEYKTSGDWQSDYIALGKSSQVVKFEYKKDGSWDSNDDKVWLANIKYVTGNTQLTASSNNEAFGSVDITGGIFTVGDEVSISASPADDTIALVGWYDNSAKEWLVGDGETKVSTIYTFNILEDRNISAIFKPIAIMPEVSIRQDQGATIVISDGDLIIRNIDTDSERYILSLGENQTSSNVLIVQNGVERPVETSGSYNLDIDEMTKIEIISSLDNFMTTYLTFDFKVYSKTLAGIVSNECIDFITASNDENYPWVRDNSVAGKIAYYPTNQGIHNSSSFATFEVTGTGMFVYDYRVSAEDNWDYMKVYLDNVLVKEYKTSGDWQSDYIALEKSSQTVKFEYKKDSSGNSKDDKVWLANVGLYSGGKTIAFAVNGEDYGSISLPDGLKLGDNSIDAGTKLTLNATANSGATFYGWVDGDNNLLSLDEEYTFRVFDDLTIAAVFGVDGTYIARRNGQFYTEADGGLVDALQDASSGDTVTLLKDYTLSQGVTVPAGVLFLLPYSEADVNGYTSTGFNPDGTSTNKSDLSRLYRTLTIPENVNVTVDGTIIVNAVTGRPAAGHYDMDITGGYSEIILDGNIIVRDGGLLDVFGKVTGSGMIEALDGGSVGDLYVVRNWRGGTQALNCYLQDIFPFNQYDLHNIEADLKIHSAASYYGNVKMFASGRYYYTRFSQFSQNDGLIKLAPNAYVLKTFDTVSGYTTITINGGAEEVGGSLEVAGLAMSTVDFLFPIDGHISFVLKNGEYSVNNSIKFLTGSELEIWEDATLSVNTGGKLVLYQEFNEGTPNVPATRYPQRDPVKFDLGGKLEIRGSFGGLIQADETGKVEVGENAILSVSSKEYFVDAPYIITTNLSCANDDGLMWYYYPGSNEGEAVLVPGGCQGIDYINLNSNPDGYKGHTFVLKANGQ